MAFHSKNPRFETMNLTDQAAGSVTNPPSSVYKLLVRSGVLKFLNSAGTETSFFANPMTTAGDIVYGGASGVATRLAAGAANTVLIAGSTPSYALISNANIDGSAAIAGSKLVAASASVAGAVTTGSQTFAGAKTFAGSITVFSRADTSPAGSAATTTDDAVFGSTDTANTGITIFSSSAGNGVINFGDADSNNAGAIAYTHGSGTRFRVEGTADVLQLGANYSSFKGAPVSSKTLAVYGTSTDVATVSLACYNSSAGLQFQVTDNGRSIWNVTNWPSSSTQDIGVNATTGEAELAKFTSSRRYKQDITDLKDVIDSSKIYDLRPVVFRWKVGLAPDLGFIAEEVAEHIPQAVNYACDKNGPVLDENGDPICEGVRYRQMVAILVEELKKLNARVSELEKKKDK